MTPLQAGLRLDFAPHAASGQPPYELRVVDDRGSTPVRVRPAVVPSWTRDHALEEYAPWLDQALILEQPGLRRIRLYATRQAADRTRLTIHGGTATHLGRRTEPLIETLVWVRARSRRLRHFHDRPEARILEQTPFYNEQGQECPAPMFDAESGAFHHAQEVTGALVVEYRPEFTLYEIAYDTGSSQIPPEWFREVKLAWLAGNIHDAAIPAVRVIAIGPEVADQLTFSRDFWPVHAGVTTGYRSVASAPFVKEEDGYRYVPTPEESCWDRCKATIRPDSALLTQQEMIAIRNCVEAEQSPKFHYVEESRTTRTERIYAPDNPELYIEVARPVELVMKLKRADGGICDKHPPSGCCPQITFRFATTP